MPTISPETVLKSIAIYGFTGLALVQDTNEKSWLIRFSAPDELANTCALHMMMDDPRQGITTFLTNVPWNQGKAALLLDTRATSTLTTLGFLNITGISPETMAEVEQSLIEDFEADPALITWLDERVADSLKEKYNQLKKRVTLKSVS